MPSTSVPRLRLIRHRSCSSQESAIPEGITRSRTSRFNVARLPATPIRPSRGPWLAIELCCPDGSSLTTASSEPLDPSPPLMDSRRSLLHPRKIGSRWESRGSPVYSAGLGSRAASLTPVPRRVQMTVASSSVLAFTCQLRARGSRSRCCSDRTPARSCTGYSPPARAQDPDSWSGHSAPSGATIVVRPWSKKPRCFSGQAPPTPCTRL